MKWILLLLLAVSTADAAKITTYATPNAKWKYKDWKIDSASVCYNQRAGSIEYRNCRNGAKKLFKNKCRSVSKMYDDASLIYRKEAKLGKWKKIYCNAASSFRP